MLGRDGLQGRVVVNCILLFLFISNLIFFYFGRGFPMEYDGYLVQGTYGNI